MINRTLTSEVSRGNCIASSVGGDRDTDHGTQQVRGVLSRVKGVGLRSAVAGCPVQVVFVGLQRKKIKKGAKRKVQVNLQPDAHSCWNDTCPGIFLVSMKSEGKEVAHQQVTQFVKSRDFFWFPYCKVYC